MCSMIESWSIYEKLWEEDNVPDHRHGGCFLDRLYVTTVAERCADRAD